MFTLSLPNMFIILSFLFSLKIHYLVRAHRGGVEVADWTADRTIRVRVPAYPHCVWALWWQGGQRRLRTSRCPCRGRLGTLKTSSCPSRWVPGCRSKFGNWTTVPSLYSWHISECDVEPQPTNQPTSYDNIKKHSQTNHIRVQGVMNFSTITSRP